MESFCVNDLPLMGVSNFKYVVGEGPADDVAQVEVDDDGEIEPFVGGGNVVDTSCPELVRLFRQRLVNS